MTTKRCPACGDTKPVTEFYRNGRYWSSYCKPCMNLRTRAFAKTEAGRAYKAKNNRRYRDVLKTRARAHLGGVCCQCGFADDRALQIDHVNGDGHEERAKDRSRTGLYRRVLKSVPGVIYQLLCANCNAIKQVENQEWPAA